MLKMLKGFVSSAKQITNIVYNPANAGNGFISAEFAGDAAPDETWTIAFTSATAFTVTGSASGLQTATGTAGSYQPEENTALTGQAVTYASDSGEVTFRIIIGNNPWVSGDSITLDVVAGLGVYKWTVKQYTDSDIAGSVAGIDKQIIFNAPGTGANEVYCGIQMYQNTVPTVPIYGWKLAGFTGYLTDAAIKFAQQPGLHAGMPRCLFSERESQYKIVANGRRVMMFYQVIGDVYECMHLGLMLPYGLPNENPYPMLVGGTTPLDNIDWLSTSEQHTAFWNFAASGDNPGTSTSGKVWDGAWFPVANKNATYDQLGPYDIFRVWPWQEHHANNNVGGGQYGQQTMIKIKRNYDGSYPTLPAVVWKGINTKRILGRIEGLYAIPGDAVAAGDRFVIDSIEYYVFPQPYLRTPQDWCALKME